MFVQLIAIPTYSLFFHITLHGLHIKIGPLLNFIIIVHHLYVFNTYGLPMNHFVIGFVEG